MTNPDLPEPDILRVAVSQHSDVYHAQSAVPYHTAIHRTDTAHTTDNQVASETNPAHHVLTPTLSTERLRLRAWTADDADSLFAAASNPDIGPLCGWPAHCSREESIATIKHVFNTADCFAIEYEGNAIGCIQLKPCNAGHVLLSEQETVHARELGYWLARNYWGLGIIPEAGERIMNYAYDELHLHTIWGMHSVDNRRSRRVLEKLGMHRVRIAPHVAQPLLGEDTYVDLVIQCITRDEWKRDPHIRDYFNAPTEEYVLSIPFVQPDGVVKR